MEGRFSGINMSLILYIFKVIFNYLSSVIFYIHNVPSQHENRLDRSFFIVFIKASDWHEVYNVPYGQYKSKITKNIFCVKCLFNNTVCRLTLYHTILTFNDPEKEVFLKHYGKRRTCW